MHSRTYRSLELLLLFVALPLSFLIAYPIAVKASLVVSGFVYILVILFKYTKTSFKIKKSIDWRAFFKRTAITFLIIAIVTTLYVYVVDASLLFYVPLNNPGLFVVILAVYTFLSVWPQEVIYRTFFFERYEGLIQNKKLVILLNALLFSLAHIFFKNILVCVLTFFGGLLFAYTFTRTKSTTLVSIEHALYGNWLFTVGMGQMLAFPGMEN